MLMDLHMHSKYSDGRNSPEEMIEAAIGLGFTTIAITDHVWKTSTWIPAYSAHLNRLKSNYENAIQIYCGVEAKVVTLDGEIDVDLSMSPFLDLILGSFHRIPKPNGFYSRTDLLSVPNETVLNHWFMAFSNLLKNPHVDIIAHPFAELKDFGLHSDQKLLEHCVDLLKNSGKIIEINVRHKTPDQELIDSLIKKRVPLVISSDSHSVEDLIKYKPFIKEKSALCLPEAQIQQYVLNRKNLF